MTAIASSAFPVRRRSAFSFMALLERMWPEAEKAPPLPPHAMRYYADFSLRFEPGKWNRRRTRWLSNCYSYALNIRIGKLTHFAPQPGQTGLPFRQYLLSLVFLTRKTITAAACADGLIPYDPARPVPPGHYLAALRYRPGFLCGDYHWYRLDRGADGGFVWTHKPGMKKATDCDRNGAIIRCLSQADPGRACPRWGGYFLIPCRQNA